MELHEPEDSPEMRKRALRMLAERRPSHPNMMSAVRHVAGLFWMSPGDAAVVATSL